MFFYMLHFSKSLAKAIIDVSLQRQVPVGFIIFVYTGIFYILHRKCHQRCKDNA